MYNIHRSTTFKKDYKLIKKRGRDTNKLKSVINQLASKQTLSERLNDHKLIGNWQRHRECHIEPDWLLIYKIDNNILQLVRTGSHADLFR